ncbi:hypothetical protein BC629DRAFT_1592458 [Irpex lacteus]|nr:hypothetical protein BC629DRAFT_1592458 [Irpex lacteus]
MARQNTGKGKGGEANSLPVTGSSQGGPSATAVLMRCRFIEQKPGAITTKSGRLQNYTILESEKISKARDEYLAAEKERKRKKEEEEEKAKTNDAGSGGQGLQAAGEEAGEEANVKQVDEAERSGQGPKTLVPLNDDMPHLPHVHSGVITPTDYYVFGGAELSVNAADAAATGDTDSLTLTIGNGQPCRGYLYSVKHTPPPYLQPLPRKTRAFGLSLQYSAEAIAQIRLLIDKHEGDLTALPYYLGPGFPADGDNGAGWYKYRLLENGSHGYRKPGSLSWWKNDEEVKRLVANPGGVHEDIVFEQQASEPLTVPSAATPSASPDEPSTQIYAPLPTLPTASDSYTEYERSESPTKKFRSGTPEPKDRAHGSRPRASRIPVKASSTVPKRGPTSSRGAAQTRSVGTPGPSSGFGFGYIHTPGSPSKHNKAKCDDRNDEADSIFNEWIDQTAFDSPTRPSRSPDRYTTWAVSTDSLAQSSSSGSSFPSAPSETFGNGMESFYRARSGSSGSYNSVTEAMGTSLPYGSYYSTMRPDYPFGAPDSH